MNSPSFSRSIYFFTPQIDFLLLGGGSILFFLLAHFFPAILPVSEVQKWAALLVVGVNHPHFAATAFRLYRHPDHRAQFPVTTWAVPLVIAALTVFALREENFARFWIRLFLLWSPFHYAGQVYGITLLYLTRAGYSFSNGERRLFYWACLMIFIYSSIRGETYFSVREYSGLGYPGLGLPVWLAERTLELSGLIWGAFLFRVLQRGVRLGEWIPWIALVPGVSFFVWFIPGGNQSNFQPLVPLFHSVQYLAVAWLAELHEFRRGKLTSSLLWALAIALGGALLFQWIPERVQGPVYTFGIVIASVQIHHFFVDGVIWRLRSKSGRKLTQFTWGELGKGRTP